MKTSSGKTLQRTEFYVLYDAGEVLKLPACVFHMSKPAEIFLFNFVAQWQCAFQHM